MNFVRKEPIEKGWSADKKYHVTDQGGNEYILRVSPKEKAVRKKNSFEMTRLLAERGVPMSLPVEFGECEDGVYLVYTWIKGKDAPEVIASLSEEKQYQYGLDAGRILKQIHCIPAPSDLPSWETRFNEKIDRVFQMYDDCPLKHENGELLREFIEKNRGLLALRGQVFQHGDYHPGNLMIDENGKLVVIDFDRDDYGDPWEEFNRMGWCVDRGSEVFASGMIDGYFEGEIPNEFWILSALYIALNSLSFLPWSIPYGEEEIAISKRQAQEILVWYDNMKKTVPSWYQRG